MRINVLFAVLSAILSFSSMNRAADIYYDVNFSSPEHTVGLPPAVGNSPTRPSSIVYGSPIVASSLGALNDQPLVFNTAGNKADFFYDQIEFDVEKSQPRYYVSFDMITESLLGSKNHFVLNFDVPSVRNIQFESDGSILIYSHGFETIGRFNDDTIMHAQIALDMIGQKWSIIVNDSPLYNGPFIPDSDLQSIRFSIGLLYASDESDDQTFVGLDNIVVSNAPVPEPATLLLLGLGAVSRNLRRFPRLKSSKFRRNF